jgi:NAD(P) transhydrogenase subunit alpha
MPALSRAGLAVVLEGGAGEAAGFRDEAYREKGAQVAGSRREVFAAAVILQVRTPPANPEAGRADLDFLRPGQLVIGFANPLSSSAPTLELAARGVTAFAMELMPRITRAQTMDALSSQATVAGYKAVVLVAQVLSKMFPKLTTAAGTIAPARLFVVGAGVAGLQAIASARRFGAVVEAYDVRPAAKEQVKSLGAMFVELPLEAGDAEDRGGYARAQDEAFYRRQRETMARVVAGSDAVITTALVPGKRAPVLVTGDMVASMAPGSVIVDLAAEQGGNCELTRPDEMVTAHGVTIFGPTNLAATAPFHASQMYAKNVSTFLVHLLEVGSHPASFPEPAGPMQPTINPEDEITRETLVSRGGEIVHPRVREALGLEPAPAPRAERAAAGQVLEETQAAAAPGAVARGSQG